MIKTSEVKNKTELSRKIINQFLKDDILLNNEKFDFFYDNLNKSWKAKVGLHLYISTEKESLILLHKYNSDELKLIGSYIYIGEFNINRFSKNKCFRDAYKQNPTWPEEQMRSDLDKELVIEFVKSKSFKMKVLNMYNEYYKAKLSNKDSYKEKLTDLYDRKITDDEASAEQKFYAYFQLEKDNNNCHNFFIKEFKKEFNNEELISIRNSIVSQIPIYVLTNETSKQFDFFYWFNKFIDNEDNLLTSICKFLLLILKDLHKKYYEQDAIDGFYIKKDLSKYRPALMELQNYMLKLRHEDDFKQQLEQLNLTNLEIRDLLRMLSFYDIQSLTSGREQLIDFISNLNKNFIFDLNYFNNESINDTNISEYYAPSFLKELNMNTNNSTFYSDNYLHILFIPKYVKVLYTYEAEFEKLKALCNLTNKKLSDFIPEETEIHFIIDENKDEIINRIV